MRTDISLYAYDVLDQIQLTLTYRQQYAPDEPYGETITLVSERLDGRGTADPREAAREVLIAAMESL